jgi:hypothetical protein
MLASFNDTWDWTAVGTLALAAVTFVLLVIAAISLRQTRKEIGLSRKEVEEAHRPVVVPVADQRSVSLMLRHNKGSSEHVAMPDALETHVLFAPIENIGAGPALRVEATASSLDPDSASQDVHTSDAMAGMGKGWLIALRIGWQDWESETSFKLIITYDDVADQKWATTANYRAKDKQYSDVEIKKRET